MIITRDGLTFHSGLMFIFPWRRYARYARWTANGMYYASLAEWLQWNEHRDKKFHQERHIDYQWRDYYTRLPRMLDRWLP